MLAVWSPAAAAKMAAGRGGAFAKEIFWAAKSRKLVFAVIEQNDEPTDESDAAFYASMSLVDTSSLMAMLDNDEEYCSDPVVREELQGQYFRIEGIRRGRDRMGPYREGLLRLQREVLAPPKPAIALARKDVDSARDAIDRREQLDVLDALVEDSRSETPCLVSLHASDKCHPVSIWKRLDVTERATIWRAALPDPVRRREHFVKQVNGVLAEAMQQIRDGVSVSPYVIHTEIAAKKAGVKDWEHVKSAFEEWQAALGDISVPAGFPVLFAAVLMDESALEADDSDRRFGNRPWIRLGRVPAGEVVDWSDSNELGALIERYGFVDMRDEDGQPWATREWIRQRFETLFEGREIDPTMTEARREAEVLLDKAVRFASGAAPTARPAGANVFRVNAE